MPGTFFTRQSGQKNQKDSLPNLQQWKNQAGTPLIYLNNAATTWPKPPEVLEEVNRCLHTPFFEAGRSTAGTATDYPAAAREALARFFNAEKPDHFIFTRSATDSLNLLIHGFREKRGSAVPCGYDGTGT